MRLASRSLVLPTGLQLHLLHQPDARQAAALIEIGVGSHDEPEGWPGLAHLLEHMLFTGSAAYPDAQRLMPWVQGAGGRVNATTLQQRTAFFFEIAAPQLVEGLARLLDMIAAPLLTPATIAREVAVIDAEYQLLQRHGQTLSEAALLDGAAQPAAFRRFHIGSRASFGQQSDALREALRHFHQQHYHGGNMQLWLQGPQSLDELEGLARCAVTGLPSASAPLAPSAPPRLEPHRDSLLRVAGPARFWLSYLLPHSEQALRDSVTLAREFALDDAPGSLLETLRSQGLCDALSMKWLYLSANASWLALVFEGEKLSPDKAQKIEAIWLTWLQALRHSSAAQRAHYQALAEERFAQLSPLDQLRERAFGFAPGKADPDALIRAANAACATRLFSAPEIAGDACCSQGLTLHRQRWRSATVEPVQAAFAFYPLSTDVAEPALPVAAQPLLHCQSDSRPATLILRPDFFSNFSVAEGKARARQLRAFLGALRHLGGEGEFSPCDGVWQLRLRLPRQNPLWAVNEALKALSRPAGENRAAQEEGIAIRTLLG
ncbi:pyrroloquinoline quinone biosynthesis protein PqqF, partial [Pantoea sp.]|uniref:pyrroloquinoline quinone biosynthesis protein PqqF n=2 Tax=Pantoea sp. TaxID=69393 RepID=UPI00289A3563